MGHMRLRIPQTQTKHAFIGPSTPVKRPPQKKLAQKKSGAPVAERPRAPREDVLRILLQRKAAAPELSQPGDRFEEEAERTAEQVMQTPERDAASQPPVISRMPAAEEETSLSRMCADCAEEKERAVQRAVRAPGAEIGEDAAEEIQRLRNSSGEKLPESERTFFEGRFGRDFSQVRLHTGDAAERATRAVNARAFTVGRDIVFGKGQFQPGTREGRRLMAHELTHTVQQGAGGHQIQRAAPAVALVAGLSLAQQILIGAGIASVAMLAICLVNRNCRQLLERLVRSLSADIMRVILEMSQHGRGRQIDSGILDELIQKSPNKGDWCVLLEALLELAKQAGDTDKQRRIKTTQKALGCRHSRNL